MQTKTCTKCKKEKPATFEFFYKNSGGKFGVTPRCKPCVNVDNALGHAARMQRDPTTVRAQANERSKRHYHADLDRGRKRARDSAAKARQDPVKLAKIKARKRADGAGLSPEQINELRRTQENKCAICKSPDPTDLDHCHSSGVVRWLLCKHCNRGLGAFRDSPALLRKAAELLEDLTTQKTP